MRIYIIPNLISIRNHDPSNEITHASQTNTSSSSSSSRPKKIITLNSFDGQSFEIEESAALQSKILEFMIDENCADDPIPIPLPRATGDILSKVVEYCNKHAQRGIVEDALKAWDDEFVRLGISTLLDLVWVANFLEINSLMYLARRAAARLFGRMTIAEMSEFLRGNDDFTIPIGGGIASLFI